MRRPSNGLVIAVIALGFSITGTAVAKSLITSGDIRNHTIQTVDISARAVKDLQGLGDEFDLADATGAELDVGRVVLAPALAPDLAVNIAQAAVGVVVEIFSKHEWLDQPQERVALVPGQRSRLQPGIALPGPPLGDQIRFQRHER